MDVTSQNFWQTFPAVIRDLARADFAAFDLEMTGIISKDARLAKLSINDVYDRARKVAMTHQVIQFGLTCIQYVEETDGKSTHHPLSLSNSRSSDGFSGYVAGENLQADIVTLIMISAITCSIY